MKKLTKKKKKNILMIVFWFVICLIFFALSTLLVLWAAGYKYNFATKKFHKTGLIYLVSDPAYAKVYLDGKLKTNKTPTTISYLAPGNYQVSIKKEGYSSWSKDIKVVAGKVKRYDNIILFLAKSQDNSTEIAQKVTNFSLAPNKNKVLIWGEKTIIYDLKNHKIINTISLSNIKFSEWSPDSKKILLYGGKDYYVYDLAVNKASRIKLTDKSNIKKIAWHNGDSNKLFLLRKVNLYLIDLAKTTTLLASNISNLAVAENGLIYLAKIDHQYFLEKSDFNLKNNQRIINLKTDNYQIFAQDSDYFLKNSDGTFYLVSGNKLKKINSQVSLIVFSNDEGFWGFGKKTKILYKTALDEIWSYDPKEQTNDLIFRDSKSIQKIAWYSDLAHVLFLTENKIKVVELDGTNEITIAHGLNFDLVNEKELIYLDLNKTVKIIEIRK